MVVINQYSHYKQSHLNDEFFKLEDQITILLTPPGCSSLSIWWECMFLQLDIFRRFLTIPLNGQIEEKSHMKIKEYALERNEESNSKEPKLQCKWMLYRISISY